MKRFFALALAIVMTCAFLCACGNKNEAVKTTVSAKYDDGYAAKYATSTAKDDNGNTVYEFSGEKYNDYLNDHKNSLGSDIQKESTASTLTSTKRSRRSS